MSKKTLARIHKLLDEISDGIEEYACSLASTDVIRDPLDKIYEIIENEMDVIGHDVADIPKNIEYAKDKMRVVII